MAQRPSHDPTRDPAFNTAPADARRPAARLLPFPIALPRPVAPAPARPPRALAPQDRVLLGIAVLAAVAAAIVATLG